MKIKGKKQLTSRNWALVIVASIVIVISATLLLISVWYWTELGWWAPALAISAATSLILSIQSIRKNDPVWLMLDLILPG